MWRLQLSKVETTIGLPQRPPLDDRNAWADFWFYDIGVNVIPAKTRIKATFEKWKENGWQIKSIPEEVFNEWKQNNEFRDGMAIITGKVWRGENAGKYFTCIDCDNLIAIEEFCTLNGKTVSLKEIAEKFIVEQHKDNTSKAHIYFYSESPIIAKSSDKKNPALISKIENGQVVSYEIKSKNNTISFCTPSIHQNGEHYQIIGTTTKPIVLTTKQANEMMQHIDSICTKYGLQYLELDNGNGKALIPMEELVKEDFVIYEGHNRHEALLRYMDSRIKKLRAKITLNEIKQLCYFWNQEHCIPPLDDKEFEKQWKDATKYIAKIVSKNDEKEQRQEDEQQQVHQQIVELSSSPDLTREVTLDEIADILSTSIKKDRAAKLITFCGMLLAQTNEDQPNVGYQAESSAGKSYVALEISDYFPVEEVKEIAAASPTAFFHDSGQLDNERKALIVDLRHKILIFIDQPSYELLQRLRPILSHDKPELRYMITDKNQKHGLRTKNVIIKGPPSVFFCTTKLDPDEQERTRLILLSPETNQEKLKESLELASLRKGNYEAYEKRIVKDPKRTWLKNRIYAIREWGIREVILPEDGKTVFDRFMKEHPYLQPRYQRDFPRIFSFIKAHALLNCFNREKTTISPNTIVATEVDVDAGFALYKEIEQSNELGLSPYIHAIYQDVIEPLLRKTFKDSYEEAIEGVNKEQIMKKHFEVRHKPLSPTTLKSILLQLESVGLVRQEPDPSDKRKMLVYPTANRTTVYCPSTTTMTFYDSAAGGVA